MQLLSPPYLGNTVFNAGPAQFGHDLKAGEGVYGVAVVAPSIKGCQPLEPSADVRGKIVLLERGDCMFIDKVQPCRNLTGICVSSRSHLWSEKRLRFFYQKALRHMVC